MMEEDRDGGSFEVTLKKGETYEFYVQNPPKNVEVESAWTAATAEPEQPAGGVIKVTVTDTYSWDDEYTFTAESAGQYTFAIPAGLGYWSMDNFNNWEDPEIDYQMQTEGGNIVVVLKAGEKLTFKFGLRESDLSCLAFQSLDCNYC